MFGTGNQINDEFNLQENYSNKIIKKIESCFANYSEVHGKDNKDKVQIEIGTLLDDLEEEISLMKKTLASKTDLENFEMERREKIIENLKLIFSNFKERSTAQISSRLDYDPRESLMKKTESEQRRYREERKKHLNEEYIEMGHHTKRIKKGALKIGELLENDKVKTDKMNNDIFINKERVEKTENNLEEYLKKSSLINSCSDSCLWMTALMEFLVILLLLAI